MIRNHLRYASALSAMLLSACAENTAKPEAAAATPPVAPQAAATEVPAAIDLAKLSPEDRIGLTVHFARVGDLPGLKRMLDAGAPIDGRDTLDQTALIAAVSHDSLPAVQEILKRGATVDLVDKAGWSALHFMTFFSTETGVMTALLDAGANVNARNDRGITALYFASATGHIDQVKLLLARGADRSIASKTGWSPLRIAKVKGLEAISKLLDPEGKGEPVSAASETPAATTATP